MGTIAQAKAKMKHLQILLFVFYFFTGLVYSIDVDNRAPSTYENCDCQCNSDTWTDGNGIKGNCKSQDKNGALFCYVSGSALCACRDIQRSSFLKDNNQRLKYYSYEACTTPERRYCRNSGLGNYGDGDFPYCVGGYPHSNLGSSGGNFGSSGGNFGSSNYRPSGSSSYRPSGSSSYRPSGGSSGNIGGSNYRPSGGSSGNIGGSNYRPSGNRPSGGSSYRPSGSSSGNFGSSSGNFGSSSGNFGSSSPRGQSLDDILNGRKKTGVR